MGVIGQAIARRLVPFGVEQRYFDPRGADAAFEREAQLTRETHSDALLHWIGSTEAVKRAVCAGLGASLVLQLTVAEYTTQQHPALAVRPLLPALHKRLHLVWRSELSMQHPLLSYLGGGAEHDHLF